MNTKFNTLLGGISIGALLLLSTPVGHSAPIAPKTAPAARAQQADPEALASKNAPRIKEAFANLNNRIQLVYKGNINASLGRFGGVLIGPNSKYILTPYNAYALSTWVFASNKSAIPLKYIASVDSTTITGDIISTGIHHTFNGRVITGNPSITIENKSNEAIFFIFTTVFEEKRPGMPTLQEDRLMKLGINIVDRTEAAVKVESDIELPYNTVSIAGGGCATNQGFGWSSTDYGLTPAWYITGCGDGRSDHLSLEVRKTGIPTPFIIGDEGDEIPHLAIEPKQNFKTGSIFLKNGGLPTIGAIIRLK